MNRTFYGYCQNEPTNNVYRVVVQDDYINTQKNNFQFKRGDVLTVFFASKQTASAPKLAIYVNDTEQESSISDDNGHFIKTLDTKLDGINQAWDAGETVIFVYTKQGDSDTYYWELVNAAPATTKVYGVTKLFDVANLNDALSGNYTPLNDTVLTPEALKNFYDKLMAVPEEEEEEEESPLGLTWVPNADLGDKLDKLGELSLSNGTTSIEINYPLEKLINLKIPAEKTHTGELINNGNGGIGEGHGRDESEPFITRIIPDDLYFNVGHGLYYYSPNSERQPQDGTPLGIPIITPYYSEGNLSYLLLGQGNVNKVKIQAGLDVIGSTNIAGTLTTTGTIDASSAQIKTLGDVKGTTLHGNIIYENTTSGFKPLSQIYSKELFTVTHKISNIKIGKATYKTNQEFLVPTTCKINGVNISCRPLGVVGYNISTPTNGYGASYCMLFALMFYEKKGDEYKPRVIYNVRNTHTTKEVTVDLELKILYETN